MINSLEELTKRESFDKEDKKLAIAVAEDVYLLKAVEKIYKLGFITPILIGDQQKIQAAIKSEKLQLPLDSIYNSSTHEDAASIAVDLIRTGEASMLMKGLLPTRIFIRAIINKDTGIINANNIKAIEITIKYLLFVKFLSSTKSREYFVLSFFLLLYNNLPLSISDSFSINPHLHIKNHL